MKIIAATQNAHKITEIDAITKGFGLKLCSMKDAGLGDLDIEETGSTFEENSFIKAEAIVRLTGEAAIADDTGLMIDALDGAPGIYSARFSGEHGNDAANRAKVLDLMKDVPEEKRTARFVCVITFLRPDGEKIVAKGACEGKITEKEMGELGFGYDSIFMPDGKDLTFAQMPAEEKNAMSHRARALQALREELLKRPGLAEGAGVKDEAPWRKAYDYWLTCPAISAEDKKELAALTDEKDIEERFISDLKFGTGGLRGKLGLGSSRMNRYNVRKATAGFARHLIKKFGEDAKKRGVAVAWDSRHFSPEFAEETALTMASYGIRAYLYGIISPTPLLSFTVRELGCCGGVVITASHNAKEYNGYKAYDETGCQLGAEDAASVIEEASAVGLEDVEPMDRSEAERLGLLTVIGKDVLDRFEDRCLAAACPVSEEFKEKIRIVYTPLHGAGNVPVREVLAKAGYKNVSVVKAQELPDGDFPTVEFPNPEIESAVKLAMEQAEEEHADLMIATDPDSDRLGFAARDKDGRMVRFNGNQIGVLFLNYLIERRKDRMPEKPVLFTTVVTGEMGPALARACGMDVRLTLTGFKHLGAAINRMNENKDGSFMFAYEESFGYLVTDHCRDKDGVSAALKTAEMCAYYMERGMTIPDVLDGLSEKLGHFFDLSSSYTLLGLDGARKIMSITEKLRELGTDFMDGIVRADDYGPGLNGLPPENLIRFTFGDGSWIACRPSGTEPKIKFYYSIKGRTPEECVEIYKAKRRIVDQLVESMS
ncbi:MAG: RdgB/HAM1 family non-canonical purine NTP pyrophosphatase [Firmicutes bacterium]|nr:RdgB/HAM1 family non-canonical purine NTP pyrophosphatase [Bacillota bacterium]